MRNLGRREGPGLWAGPAMGAVRRSGVESEVERLPELPEFEGARDSRARDRVEAEKRRFHLSPSHKALLPHFRPLFQFWRPRIL